MPTVVLLEDNADDEALFRRVWKLVAPHHRLEVAKDGKQAVEMVDRLTRENDVVLMVLDVKVPFLSGLEVLNYLRQCESTRHTPAVMFTSSDEAADVQQALHCGANGFVRKPVDFDEYREAVRSILEYWTRLNVVANAEE